MTRISGELAQPKASQPFFRPRGSAQIVIAIDLLNEWLEGFAEKHEAEGSPSRPAMLRPLERPEGDIPRSPRERRIELQRQPLPQQP